MSIIEIIQNIFESKMLITITVLFENDKFIINVDEHEKLVKLYDRIIASGPYFIKDMIVITDLDGYECDTTEKFGIYPIKYRIFKIHQK